MEATLFKKIYPSEFYKKFLAQQVRPNDGRSLIMTRAIKLAEQNSISTADGSSFLKMGNTLVLCGITAELGPLQNDDILCDPELQNDPHIGTIRNIPLAKEKRKVSDRIIINADFGPICNARVRSTKPSAFAQALTHHLNRIIDSKDMIRFEAMSFDQSTSKGKEETEEDEDLKKKLGWYLYVDLYCLNYDGNLFDAALIAMTSALKNLSLPQINFTTTPPSISTTQPRQQALTFNYFPIPLTFALVEGSILADPTADEEEVATAMFSIVMANNSKKLIDVCKLGGNALSFDRMVQCVERTKQRVSEVVPILNEKK